MIDFFLNIMMYLVIILGMLKYFKQLNIYSFMIILFNMNAFFLFLHWEINFLIGLALAISSILLYEFFKLLKGQNEEIILIQNGNINFHELLNNYNYTKLMRYLKRHKIKLDEIAYCLKKNNQLVVIKNNEINGYPVSLIIDGKLMESNLKLIHKDATWLKEELLNKHLLLSMINYAYYKNNQVYFICN